MDLADGICHLDLESGVLFIEGLGHRIQFLLFYVMTLLDLTR